MPRNKETKHSSSNSNSISAHDSNEDDIVNENKRRKKKNRNKKHDKKYDNVSRSSIKNNDDKYDNKRKKKQHDSSDSSSASSSTHGRDEDDKKRNRKRSNRKKSDSNRKRKHHHHRSSSNNKKRKSSHDYSSSSSSSSSSSESDDEMKYKKKDKKQKRRRKANKKSNSTSSTSKSKLLKVLSKLITSYPLMIKQLPYILYKMIHSETIFNVSSMEPKEIGALLEQLFICVNKEYGDDIISKKDDSWCWNKQLGRNEKDGLKLIKILKVLLDNSGITMNAVHAYESRKLKLPKIEKLNEKVQSTASNNDNDNNNAKIQKILMSILSKQGNNYSVLAKEICNLCAILQQGELLSLETIPDKNLQIDLKYVFDNIGLELFDMENDSDNEVEQQDLNKGYGLPDEDENDDSYKKIKTNLDMLMNACQTILKDYEASTASAVATNESNTNDRIKGPQLTSISNDKNAMNTQNISDDSDDDDMIGPSLPTSKNSLLITSVATQEQAEKASKKRKEQLQNVIQNKSITSNDGEREEWMTTPGEHNLLESIQRQSITKERKFQNIKSKQKDKDNEPTNPIIEQEIQNIKNEYDNLRGPSLLEQHNVSVKEENTVHNDDNNKWKWNRGDNLSDGRRVDKDALKMVLGGAKDGLNTKFHTSFSSR